MENNASSTITRKIDFTTARVVSRPTLSAEPLTRSPCMQPMTAMKKAKIGALNRPTKRSLPSTTCGRRGQVLRRRNVEQELGNRGAADQAHDVGEEREQRQRDDESDHPRHHQHLHGLDAHHLERVDFLARLHDADLGGEGGARAAGDHDRRDQHAHFAQYRYRHQVDGEVLAAVGAQLGHALVADDDRDHDGHQADDGQRMDAGFRDLPRNRRPGAGQRG